MEVLVAGGLHHYSRGKDYSTRGRQQKWDGNFSMQGERESPEMQLCFGINFESNDFIHYKGFKDAFSSLYKPIIENLFDH